MTKTANEAMPQTPPSQAAELTTLGAQVACLLPANVYVYTLPDFTLLYANVAATQTQIAGNFLHGVSFDEAIAHFLHPDDLPHRRAIAGQLAHTSSDDFIEFVERTRGPNDTWRSQLVREKVFARDITGKTTQILGVAQDITALKARAEAARLGAAQAAQRSDRQLQAVIDASTAVIFIKALDGRYLLTNCEFGRIFGGSSASMAGKCDADLFAPEVVSVLADNDRRVIQNGTGIQVEELVPVPGGDVRTYYSTKFPLRDAEGVIYAVCGFATDVTEHKKRETRHQALLISERAARETSALKSQFLATMSHEIRTPINGVLGMNDLLLHSDLNDEQRGYANAIKSSADSLLTILNDILDFSKIEAGRIDFERINFSPTEHLKSITDNFRVLAGQKDITATCDIDAAIPSLLRGDPTRLRQVLMNLGSNALKFTMRGRITFSLRSEAMADGCTKLHYSVTDSGLGISDAALKNLFKPFNQVDASTTRRFGGTGLGLSICRGLIEGMHGEIGASSDLGKGSTFYFWVVLEPASAQALASAEETVPERFCGRVLVAEDNAINQMVAKKMLERLGLQAIIVSNGAEAVDALIGSSFDLVLMDCQMPVLDGYEATQRIRALADQALARVPVVAMTANAMRGDAQKCFDAGMNDYIAKPIRADTVRQVLHRFLEAAF